MSADNYLLVRKHTDGRWYVTMESASNDEPNPVGGRGRSFRTKEEAMAYAQGWEDNDYIEYGISCHECAAAPPTEEEK